LLRFCRQFSPIPINNRISQPAGALLMGGMLPGVCRDNLAGALRFKFLNLPADNAGQEAAMKTGFEFIQRIQEDAEFRRQVNACPEGEERLAFLKSEGYDFSPFIQILNNLSSCKQSNGGLGCPGESARPRQGASGFLGRIRHIFRATTLPVWSGS
jgi:hypothetical protein